MSDGRTEFGGGMEEKIRGVVDGLMAEVRVAREQDPVRRPRDFDEAMKLYITGESLPWTEMAILEGFELALAEKEMQETTTDKGVEPNPRDMEEAFYMLIRGERVLTSEQKWAAKMGGLYEKAAEKQNSRQYVDVAMRTKDLIRGLEDDGVDITEAYKLLSESYQRLNKRDGL